MLDNTPYGGGWVKLYRSFLDWEWYSDTNCVRLALHFLLKANYQPKKWQGILIGRGQVVTSRARLSKETGLSEREVRTVWQRLTDCGFLSCETSNKYSLVTICHYDNYQEREAVRRPADDQPMTSASATHDQPRSTTKEDKNRKDKEYITTVACAPEDAPSAIQAWEPSPTFVKFHQWIVANTPNVGRMKEPFTEDELVKLKQDFTLDQIQHTLRAMHNWKPLLTKNINANLTFRRWAQKDNDEKRTNTLRTDPLLAKQQREVTFARHIATKLRGGAGEVSDSRCAAPEF